MALRAISESRYYGGVRHADNGERIPLCFNTLQKEAANSLEWSVVEGSITCLRCLRSLRGAKEKKPLEKQTLRERILK